MIFNSSSSAALSNHQVALLAVDYASASNINSFQALAASHDDVLAPGLLYKILLDFLPETLEPGRYVGLIQAIASNQLSKFDETINLDISSVQELSPGKARSRLKRIGLDLKTSHSDSLADFLKTRAHRIEEQTGLLGLIQPLVEPFLDFSIELRTWYISCILPLLRFQYEYYPEDEPSYSLTQIELADNKEGPELWLAHSLPEGTAVGSDVKLLEQSDHLARDLRGLVGPWIYGDSTRKRRRINSSSHLLHSDDGIKEDFDGQTDLRLPAASDMDQDSWHYTFQKMIQGARTRLPLIASAIENWDGPADVDLGNYAIASIKPIENNSQANYVRTALACIYAAEDFKHSTLTAAWKIIQKLDRLTSVDEFTVSLDSQLENLPVFDASDASKLSDMPSHLLEHTSLSRQDNPLTASENHSLALTRFCILSAGLLARFGHSVSTIGAIKVKLHLDADEQAALFQRIAHNLAVGRSKTEDEWKDVRQKLVWLWGWGEQRSTEGSGSGILGKIDRQLVEKIILETLVQAGCHMMVAEMYIRDTSNTVLTSEAIEQVIASTALQFYDSASNGNKTRGHMKKASDIVATFSKYCPKSITFSRLQALIAATHAISSYSLTLQHGVPFTPVSIRVSSDPLALIEKIFAQNPGSYVKAQDLITVGSNFVAAGMIDHTLDISSPIILSPIELEARKRRAQRWVIGMAIEAALHEDDFETAYSYVVNWLDTSSASHTSEMSDDDEDDIAWRAALAAGKHKSSLDHSTSNASPALRRLGQRMDLLSQALLLAPSHALPEILSAWRKCEEEMASLLLADAMADAQDYEGQDIPGAFVDAGPIVQARREIGRGAAEEAPMGLFDVARGAAAAFSKSAFPLHGQMSQVPQKQLRIVERGAGSDAGSADEYGQDRVRKRDQLANVVTGGANAVTGGLASGLGWVLGANPNVPRE